MDEDCFKEGWSTWDDAREELWDVYWIEEVTNNGRTTQVQVEGTEAGFVGIIA